MKTKSPPFAPPNQTIHFQLKENLDHTAVANNVKAEYESYKQSLERSRTRYQIIEEASQTDGPVLVRIRKQHNNYAMGDYLD